MAFVHFVWARLDGSFLGSYMDCFWGLCSLVHQSGGTVHFSTPYFIRQLIYIKI